jgi:hypothetical protein
MKLTSFIVLFATLLLVHSLPQPNLSNTYRDGGYFSSKAYLDLKADAKMEKLWEAIIKDPTVIGFYSKLKVLKIMIEDLHPTFEHYGDDFPEGRQKLIHTKGVIAKAELKIYNSEKNNYTGFLKQGSNNVLIRLSCASDYKTNKEPLNNFIPGMAIKILRDGAPSVNTVCMHSTSGQNSWNFFKNNFTNSFEIDPDSTFDKILLARRFRKVTPNISTVGIRDFAAYTESNSIPDDKVVYPYRFELHPTPKVQEMFKDEFTEDFIDILKRIPVGTPIWYLDVYDRADCYPERIGVIINNTLFEPSRFADESMFFRHALPEEDDKNNKRHPNNHIYRDSFGFFGLSEGKTVNSRSSCPMGF